MDWMADTLEGNGTLKKHIILNYVFFYCIKM